ncbi:hypothetical protein CRE_30248 [Caenorhabditis remanei]|uniref:Uncharacterized protein n=1 Tax=Caenorhabditis remanei TaxID=31234 RepID=E3NKN4_CAERE|nr:hypothetical protein CRE_30248 [Caenorhabditis remanei]
MDHSGFVVDNEFVRESNKKNKGSRFGMAVDTQWFVILSIPIITRHGRKNSLMLNEK